MASGKILLYLATCRSPQTPQDLWKVVSRDLAKYTEMIEIIQNLKAAEKIQAMEIKGKAGYMPKHKQKKEWPTELLDLEWLTSTEHF